jgi:threonine dehydratase
MRCVRAPTSLRPLAFPHREALDSVRFLGRRFPRARVREVPLLRAAELDTRADSTGATRVWLALEALQVTGSFHVRGALVALAALAARDRRRVVVPTLGNFGVAVAYAAEVLDMSATVVVPRTTPRIKREKIDRYGGTLIVADTDRYDVTAALAKEVATHEGAEFLTPNDDENIVLGNGASLGFEIVRALGGVPERVLAPVGTGALAAGLAWAIAAEAAAGSERAVWGVHSESTGALAAAFDHDAGAGVRGLDARGGGGRETVPPASLAEELIASPTAAAVDRACASVAGVVVVGEEQIGAAMAHAYQDMGLILEGTAAVALAPVLLGLPPAVRGGDLVVVLTGRNVDPERLEAIASTVALAAGGTGTSN